MPDAPEPPANKTWKKSPPGTVRREVLVVAPEVADAILASPFKRAAGMAIDLVVVVLLSALAQPILGVFTGFTVASLGSRRVSEARFWQIFRWVLVALGVVVMALSAFFVVGAPIVRTEVFNIAAAERVEAPDAPLLPPSPSYSDLARAVERYERRDAVLSKENKEFRERGAGRSLLTGAADLGKTFGLTFGWAGVYFTLMTAWFRGRTIGKLVMGTRVSRLDGKPITPMDAFIRNGGYAAGLATGLIGFMSILWDANRRAIHDRMAATVVILNRAPRASTPDDERVKVTPAAVDPASSQPASDSPTGPS